MKITIDIPEGLYRRAEIHAVETGRTLKDLVLTSLEKELDPSPTWANRKLRPDFEAALESRGLRRRHGFRRHHFRRQLLV